MSAIKYPWTKTGYDPFLISDDWQIAYLNCVKEHRLDDLVDMEIHENTDEIFICISGTGILLTARYEDELQDIEATLLEHGVAYNVPAGVWHNIAMDEDAKILIVEKSDTHIKDVRHIPLGKHAKISVDNIIKSTIKL